MKFKIVGGRRDGSWVTLEVKNGSAVLRQIQMPILHPLDISPSAVIPDEISFEYEVYTVRRLHGPKDWVLEYLALSDMSDIEAIELQFSK